MRKLIWLPLHTCRHTPTHAHTLTECIESLSWWSWENLQQQHLISIFDFIGKTRTQTCKHILTHTHTHTLTYGKFEANFVLQQRNEISCGLPSYCFLPIPSHSRRQLHATPPARLNTIQYKRSECFNNSKWLFAAASAPSLGWLKVSTGVASNFQHAQHSSNTAKAAGRRWHHCSVLLQYTHKRTLAHPHTHTHTRTHRLLR